MTATETQLEWGCTGHQPTRWMLGERHEDRIVNYQACVVRQDNGSWGWACYDPEVHPSRDRRGIEPSRITAMQAAEKELSRMTKP
jgi:hypothetical protein